MKKTRIAQISDIHWRGTSRHEEYTRSFNKLLDNLRIEKPDIILCTGDIFHTKTQGITPEVVEKMVWMFQELCAIAPTRNILGQHDGNVANNSRQDVVTPIIKALNDYPNIILFKDSGNLVDPLFPDINWCVYSCFDKDNWEKPQLDSEKVNIGLFHGVITGCQTDQGYNMTGGEQNISFFQEHDYVMMGDIHKSQFMSERQAVDGKDKPWIGYPGSLIQQNFGESTTKGYLLWDIAGKNDWEVNFRELTNFQPFITFPWLGDFQTTIDGLIKQTGGQFLEGTRFRATSLQTVSELDKRQLEEFLKVQKSGEELVWKIDVSNNMDSIQAGTMKVQKTSLRNSPEVLVQLYNEYVNGNLLSHPLTPEQRKIAEKYIIDYLAKLNASEVDIIATRDVSWSLKSIDFDNMFRFGEGNSIDFSKLQGVVGILGPNKTGKSSIIGTIMYALFNATDRGPVKTAHVINTSKKACRARAHINIGGSDYVLERTSTKDEAKLKGKKEIDKEKTSTSLVLTQVNPDGSTMARTGISRDETDKELRRLIGTAEDFLLTSLASQGDMNRFISEGATERKAILSRFLDLDIFMKLCGYAKEDCGELNTKTKKYSDTQWEKVISDIKQEISLLEASKVVLESRVTEKRIEFDELKLWIFQKEKDVDMVSILQLEEELATKEKQVENANKLFVELSNSIKDKNIELLKTDVSLREIRVEDLEALQENLQVLKEELSILASSFKVESTTLEHQEKSIRKLELVPCGETFPECHFIKDSHENKKLVEFQRNLVNNLKLEYEQGKKKTDSIVAEKISEKLKEHRTLTSQKTKLEESLRELKNRQKNIDVIRLVSEREHIKENLEKIRLSLDEDAEQEIQDKKRLYVVIKDELEQVESLRNDTFLHLGSNKQKLEQTILEKEECLGILHDLQIYESIYKAFSKNGIPAMILKGQLPSINAELDKILTSAIDFKITLETDTTSNVMDVFIEDKEGKRVIETASGMEKMITSMALRVALTNLTSLPKSDIFILDEGFGSLDDTSLHQCLQLMSLLKNYFRVILIITHIIPIKEIADKIIEINSDGSTSFVQV